MRYLSRKMKIIKLLILCVAWCLTTSCFADSYEQHLTDLRVDDNAKVILVYMDDSFADQTFTSKTIKKIYRKVTKDVHKALPPEYKDYGVRIYTKGTLIENILTHEVTVEEKKKPHRRHHGWWGDVYYDGQPWVSNVSKPHKVTAALKNKHITVWASHGKYYDMAQSIWKWQRPRLFSTTEDLFTQTIVVPYLIPMLENAGAVVFTPRERDWQTEEVIVDNDSPETGYRETGAFELWTTPMTVNGFSIPSGNISDNYNPFDQGTVRQVQCSRSDVSAKAIYTPALKKSGKYAVYVSYATVDASTDKAHYKVWHQGICTEVIVNQRMGGGTWVYLGTFDFDNNRPEYNYVELSSYSQDKCVVTTDAVRFGGGMGNIVRGEGVSGVPRCLEGARYYAQWAGVPYDVYSLYKGEDDYKDDINVRSLMSNWLSGGSPFVPGQEGKHVPIDMTLAVHSDAGYNKDFKSIFGSLAVCTTDFNEEKLAAGASRHHSKNFAKMLLEQSKEDLSARYGEWRWRDLYDKNYSETRLPAVPSAIFETLSHQSFPDMRLAHDPDFKFTLARSIYKTMLRFESEAHGGRVVVSPLTPKDFRISLDTLGNATLAWNQQLDEYENTARAVSYNIYMSVGVAGYDNGVNVSQSNYSMRLMPDIVYRFRVSAVNEGGESFPTEELAVVWHGPKAENILIVNGFQRLAAPEIINTDSLKGFDISLDPGVSYGMTAGWCGRQSDYDINSQNFGASTSEMEGKFVAGNSFNYVGEHAEAIASAYRYNIVSCTRSVVETSMIDLSRYDVVDLILGNERNDGYSLRQYKTIPVAMQQRLSSYAFGAVNSISGHHALLVSGSYVGSDMKSTGEQLFMEQVLHASHVGTTNTANDYVNGLQQTIVLNNTLNPDHYATTRSDVLHPMHGAFVCMQYSDGQTAAVAYRGHMSSFVMGFPFECISSASQRAYTMRGIISYLLNHQ